MTPLCCSLCLQVREGREGRDQAPDGLQLQEVRLHQELLRVLPVAGAFPCLAAIILAALCHGRRRDSACAGKPRAAAV